MDHSKFTPLMQACGANKLKDVKKLLANGCDINQSPEGCEGGTALHLSSPRGRLDIIELLILKGCSLEQAETMVLLLYIFHV